MKKIIPIICAAVGVLLFSCADDSLSPIITFDKAGKGAYVKLISETPRELDLMNLGAASYSYDVEFVDIEQGNLVSQYDLKVSFVDNNPVNGDKTSGPTDLRNISSGEFTTTERGFKGASISISLSELLSLFGLTADDLLANDQFRFQGFVILTDGQVFGASNSSAAVNGSAFQGHFNYTLKATCPLRDDQFVGDYTLTYQEVSGAWDESIVPGTVTLTTVAGSSTQRQFDCVYLQLFGGFATTVVIDFVCTEVIMVTTDPGVGCGSPGIILKQGDANPIDINDADADIVLHYIEDTGACGAGTPPRIMTLTKN